MEINIGVVIVTWNNEKDISECLSSLVTQTLKPSKIVVVDNKSSDRTIEIVRSKFSQVEIIPQDKNYLLTKSNNKGIRYLLDTLYPEFILVLNPDTILEKDTLKKLFNSINKDTRIGAVGPKVKFYGNKDEGLINSAGLFYDGFSQAYDIGFREVDDGSYDKDKEVFGVTGACILYRTKMIEQIGMYWEKISLYLDEVELFIRARKAGWKVFYVGSATLFHKYMASTDQIKIDRINDLKRIAWLWIAIRHYSIRSKIAMVRAYLFKSF